jgi:hypothetical protein
MYVHPPAREPGDPRSALGRRAQSRLGKAGGLEPMMNGAEKLDLSIVCA